MHDTKNFRPGVLFAVGSAVTFGVSGPFAKSLMEAGWTPAAAVIARLGTGAVVLAVFATIVNRNWLREAVQHARTVVLYGLIPIAGAQLCYYNAVSQLSVGVALLLEYQSPVLVVGWVWATTRRRPATLTLIGVALALAGTLLVLNVFLTKNINVAGVAWGLGAMVCAACYFVLSDRVTADGTGLRSTTLAASGLVFGAATVALLSISGTMPLTFTDNDIVLAGAATPWIVPVLVLGVVSAAIAYVLGISGVARLRPGYASLLGLGEVLCGVIAAWVLLGESVTAAQAMGGAVVLLGLALAGMGDHTSGPAASPPPVSDRRNCKAHSSYPADSVAATTAGVVAEQLQPAVARPELWSGSL